MSEVNAGDSGLPAWSRHRSHGNEHAARRAVGALRSAHEWDLLHDSEPFIRGGRFELAIRAHLVGGQENARLGACEHSQCVGIGERAVPVEQALHEIHLCLRERRVDPHAPSCHVMA